MKIRYALWGLPLLAMLSVPAFADRYNGSYGDSRFEQRMDRQHYRIKQGVRSGELTRKEAKRLRKQQRHIAKLERRFERDGRLDRHERKTLRRELNAASDRIYRLKHNDRYRDRYAKSHRKYDRHDHYGKHRHYDSGWSIRLGYWDHL